MRAVWRWWAKLQDGVDYRPEWEDLKARQWSYAGNAVFLLGVIETALLILIVWLATGFRNGETHASLNRVLTPALAALVATWLVYLGMIWARPRKSRIKTQDPMALASWVARKRSRANRVISWTIGAAIAVGLLARVWRMDLLFHGR